MRIAYIFIGITYEANYISSIRQHECVNNDFRYTYNTVIDNLINPYRNQGDIVDTFFVTYHSVIEDELIKLYEPKDILFSNYKQFSVKERTEKQINDRINGLDMVSKYEQINNFQYDFIIITRPDLYFFTNTTTVGIDYDYFNILFYHLNGTIFSGEDSWIGIPRIKVNYYIEKMQLLLTDLLNDVHDISTHFSGKYIIEGGETVKYLYGGTYGCNGNEYPFFKFIRYIKDCTDIDSLLKIPFNRIHYNNEEFPEINSVYISEIGPSINDFKIFTKIL